MTRASRHLIALAATEGLLEIGMRLARCQSSAVTRSRSTWFAMHTLDLAIARSADADNLARRIKARAKARELGRTCPWLRLVVEQHERIELSFEQVRAASDVASRRSAERDLALLLTGHSVAEEAVLYPAMALGDQKAHSLAGYSEHSQFKVRLALLSNLAPMSKEYEDTLDRLRRDVQWHALDEERSWYPALARSADAAVQARLGARFQDVFERYMGADAAGD